jgi:L,D-transpeptidase YbiS
MIIKIFAQTQQLILYKEEFPFRTYHIATSEKGLGEFRGSEMTPRGWHKIRVKIGEGCPLDSVFVGRRPTGEIYSEALAEQYPERDWILTRILWLTGMEPGFNRFGMRDTLRRFIYIHGCPGKVPMGCPSSHGCIRMHGHDLLELYDLVAVGTPVLITEQDNAIK